MKIVVFVASGFVGKQLVPRLQMMGHRVQVVGRNRTKLGLDFPNTATADFADFQEDVVNFDLAINLVAINSNSDQSSEEFFAINRDLLISLANKCNQVGVKKFINCSSVHALDTKNGSFYASSKREGAQALDELKIVDYFNIYIPNVHGDSWVGKLRFLNSLPKPIANFMFTPLAALKPTVSITQLAEHLLSADLNCANPRVVSEKQHGNLFYHFIRRLTDISFSILVLILFSWMLAVLWVIIKLDSSGPAIFAQRRIGQSGREFTCYKFRTMHVGTAQLATHEISKSSVTRTGKFLRKFKLDELPQIINILKNEMSLIGPRPCLPNQTELIRERTERGVLKVKPGISGYSQVRNVDMSNPILLANEDAAYIGMRGLVLDFKIAFQTALGYGSNDKISNK